MARVVSLPSGPGMVRSVWTSEGSERMARVAGPVMSSKNWRILGMPDLEVGKRSEGIGGRRLDISSSYGGRGSWFEGMVVIVVFGVCSAIDLIDVLDTNMPFHQDIIFYCIYMRFGLYLVFSL